MSGRGNSRRKKNKFRVGTMGKNCCDLSQAKLPLGMCNKKSSLFVIKYIE